MGDENTKRISKVVLRVNDEEDVDAIIAVPFEEVFYLKDASNEDAKESLIDFLTWKEL